MGGDEDHRAAGRSQAARKLEAAFAFHVDVGEDDVWLQTGGYSRRVDSRLRGPNDFNALWGQANSRTCASSSRCSLPASMSVYRTR
jgi:hypothetical protein